MRQRSVRPVCCEPRPSSGESRVAASCQPSPRLWSLWCAHNRLETIAAQREKGRGNRSVVNYGRDTPMRELQKLLRFARKSPGEQLARVQYHLEGWGWNVPRLGNDRTAYVIGLFGTGRSYVIALLRKNIGERAKYYREGLRCHAGPTSMIYSGHATMKYVSRAQASPAVTSRVLKAVRYGYADLMFLYRHPLDSLLTNWVWWRIRRRGSQITDWVSAISQVYKNTDELCAAVEENFSELKAFAAGDPDFAADLAEPFADIRGPRFLSFAEFVEETELFLRSAPLSLRLEDFTIDPLKEFSKIAELMSVDLDLSRLHLAPPRAMPNRYLAVKEKVPQFRRFHRRAGRRVKKTD